MNSRHFQKNIIISHDFSNEISFAELEIGISPKGFAVNSKRRGDSASGGKF